ncbi:oxygen-independent coproporphyrinogen III oxidase [Dysgonamonadaceae bacterium]|nr:oxygen-independent coproporphyrinogen III oxidase [Dysgonamonadaceae bacterium]
MNQHILEKYNVPVPRYTSYPPANFFRDDFTERNLLQAIEESNSQRPHHISFYIHIPYCKRMCYYCGCNSYPRTGEADEKAYVEAVLKEIELVCDKIDKSRKIAQIHYGGGSPSSIDLNLIRKINDSLFSKFDCIENPEIAIECHAGYLTEKDFQRLIDAEFNRMSIGIQDFDNNVLKASNRIPTLLPIEQIFELLRSNGIRINLDFIYGLALQTADSFSKTIEKAVALSPDRLVTFSYAHLPSLFPRQKFLERFGLPSENEKDKMYHAAQKILLEAGYKQIGLDHFVRENDELFEAWQMHNLNRNFQGYCTRRTTGQVYAFGVTGISQLTGAYAQNTKVISEYVETVNSGHIPVKKGYRLNNDEQITREVITDLMCNDQIEWQQIAARLNLTIAEVKAATAYSEQKMQEFAADGIIDFDENHLVMKEKGSPFLRNVAASLDKLLIHSNKLFSKPI